jgi:hypothetical protein
VARCPFEAGLAEGVFEICCGVRGIAQHTLRRWENGGIGCWASGFVSQRKHLEAPSG